MCENNKKSTHFLLSLFARLCRMELILTLLYWVTGWFSIICDNGWILDFSFLSVKFSHVGLKGLKVTLFGQIYAWVKPTKHLNGILFISLSKHNLNPLLPDRSPTKLCENLKYIWRPLLSLHMIVGYSKYIIWGWKHFKYTFSFFDAVIQFECV